MCKQLLEGTKFAILAPLQLPEGRALDKQLSIENQQGYSRIWYKNDFVRIDDFLTDKEAVENAKPDEIYILIDRMAAQEVRRQTSHDSPTPPRRLSMKATARAA